MGYDISSFCAQLAVLEQQMDTRKMQEMWKTSGMTLRARKNGFDRSVCSVTVLCVLAYDAIKNHQKTFVIVVLVFYFGLCLSDFFVGGDGGGRGGMFFIYIYHCFILWELEYKMFGKLKKEEFEKCFYCDVFVFPVLN